jgi:hypothetical protein
MSLIASVLAACLLLQICLGSGSSVLNETQVFMDRMEAPAYFDIKSLDDLSGKSDFAGGVTFVLYYTHTNAEGAEEEALAVFKSVAARMKGAAFAVLAAGAGEEAVRGAAGYKETLVRVQLGRPPLSLTGAALLSPSAVEAFVAENNYPLCGEMTQLSLQRLHTVDKLMVVAVVDPNQVQTSSAIRQPSIRLPSERANQYIFGLLDGVRWGSFVAQHNSQLNSLLVLDNRRTLRRTLPVLSASASASDPTAPTAHAHTSEVEVEVRVLLAKVLKRLVGRDWLG